MNKFYYCSVCEQTYPEEDIVQVQNVLSKSKTWKECPTCGSKVLRVSNDDLDARDLIAFQFHKELS